MAETLSPADRSSLAAEIGTVNMAVGGLLVFEGGPGLEYDAVLARVAGRLHLVPRYRQRLHSTAAGFANPVWVDDDGFDLSWHVRSAMLPAPGGERALAALVGREMSRRLDRSRPLWELTVIDGLEGGRRALLAKMHHALVDGVAAVDIGPAAWQALPMPKTSGWQKLMKSGSFSWTLSLDGLRRKLAKGLEVRVDEPEVRRGGEIAALVVVSDPAPLGELEVGVVCTEHYDEIRQGHESQSRTTCTSIEHEQWQPVQGAGEHSVRFAIPGDAPFSYEGSCLSLRWEVVARGRRDRALDARASHEISVLP